MQQQNLKCERDEYPPIGFWQDQDIHSQFIRMVPKTENGDAGAALFALGFCRYDGNGRPPASTRNARFDRIVHGPDRDTEVSTADVTTTLSTVTISFNAMPAQADDGITANPCWPSTLVDDPGFALLTDDPWYFAPGNDQRRLANRAYANPPPLALTQNNPPRPGYQKRFLDLLDMDLALDEGNTTQKLMEDYLSELGMKCSSTNCVDELKRMKALSLDGTSPKVHSLPRASEAEPTAADTNLAPAATSTGAMVGGGAAQLALDSFQKPTGRTE